jgi:hypothetical protein
MHWWESQKVRDHWKAQDIVGWDNIKMDVREIGCDGIDWIDLAQDKYQWMAHVYTAMNLRVP